MMRLRMIRRYARTRALWLFTAACASQEASCPVEPLAPGMCAGFTYMDGSHPCVALEVYPRTGEFGSVLLRGDTLRMSTSSDSGYAAPVTWSLVGDAAVAVAASEREENGLLGRYASILVKGVQPGSAIVTASHNNAAHTASTTLTVADSSIITRIVLSAYPTTVKVGTDLYVSARMEDATGKQYRAQPEQWSTSDTTVARIQAGNYGRFIRGRSPGTVDVIASFLTLRGTLRITVIP